MSESHKSFVPQTLDDPPKFLFWDFDVALLFIVSLGFGIMTNQILVCSVLGSYLTYRYGRAKSGQSPGYGLHLMYWYLPIGVSLKRIPPSSTRNFLG